MSLGHVIGRNSHSKIKANAARARELYTYAATYFGDADAQYELGRLYLETRHRTIRTRRRAGSLAANKGQCRAEAALRRYCQANMCPTGEPRAA